MKYRANKKSGIIHSIVSCCWQGAGLTDADKAFESRTLEEAKAEMKSRGLLPQRCQRCRWTNEEREIIK